MVRAHADFLETLGSLNMVVHAHNNYLQAAVDYGLPGFAAYVALLVSVFGSLWALMRHSREHATRYLAAALAAGLLAHQLYGLTDAITLGAKPGFIFWCFLGVAGCLVVRERVAHASQREVGAK